MEIKIRKAKVEDVKILKELKYNLLKFGDDIFDDISDPEWAKTENCAKEFKQSIEDPNTLLIVAEDNNQIIGFLIGEVFEAQEYKRIKIDAELHSMYIREKYRRQKIGSKLVDEFIKWCKSMNADQVKVEPFAGNKKALDFYKKEGFEDYVVMLRMKL